MKYFCNTHPLKLNLNLLKPLDLIKFTGNNELKKHVNTSSEDAIYKILNVESSIELMT